MEVNSITFDGVNSLDYGLYVSGSATFSSAEKEYTKVSVPGRDGDLLISNNRYKNVSVQYPAVIFKDLEENTKAVRNWLLSTNGYCRLEDTYHPDEYRMAVFSGPIEFTTAMFEAGATTLTFDCKPQRWLKSGEQKQIFTDSSKKILNPSKFASKPLIRAYLGSAMSSTSYVSLQVGTGSLRIKAPSKGTCEYIDIDCDIMDCYSGLDNRNDLVSVVRSWPTLAPGWNGVIFTPEINGGLSKVEIIPRWWIL